jgi:membrane protease YdiL (CAAX protease family)
MNDCRVVSAKLLIGSAILLLAWALGAGLWLAGQLLPAPFYVVTAYGLIGFLVLALSLPPHRAGSIARPLPAWQALLLFLVVMSIRLPSYASLGLLAEKVPTIVMVALWARFVLGWRAADLGLSWKRMPRQVLLGLGLALLYWVLFQGGYAAVTAWELGIISVQWYSMPVAETYPGFDSLLLVALSFLYSNFAEELFFRAFLLRDAIRTLGWRLAGPFLLQAALFGLYHVNYGLFPNPGQAGPIDAGFLFWYVAWTALFGVGFGFVYLWSGSVVTATILHVLSNLFAGNAMLLFMPQRGYIQGNVWGALSYHQAAQPRALLLVAVAFDLVLFLLWRRSRAVHLRRKPCPRCRS